MDWLRLLLYPDGGDGAGGGGTGAPTGGADSGVATLDPPAEGGEGDGTEGDPDPDLTADEGEGEGSGEGEGEPTGAEGGEPQPEDKRLIPNYIRSLQKDNPDGYKKAKADFFELRARRGVHETAQQAVEEHGLIESLGGREGVAKLQGDVGVFHEASKQFLNADPAFAKDLFEENSIAAGLLIQPMLDEFKTRDESGYKDTVARLFKAEMDNVNLAGGLRTLSQLIQGGKKDEALRLLGDVLGWTKDIENLIRPEDPRVKSLLAEKAKDREGVEKTAHQQFIQSYQTEATDAVVMDAAKTFDQYFKNKKLSKDDRDDLLREVFNSATKVVTADKSFIEQRNSHLQRRDGAAAKRLVVARYQREILPAVQKVARRYGLISGKFPQQGKPQGGPGNNGKPMVKPAATGYNKIDTRPRAGDIDRDKTSDHDIAIGKRAILKDGRRVTWAHLSQRAS